MLMAGAYCGRGRGWEVGGWCTLNQSVRRRCLLMFGWNENGGGKCLWWMCGEQSGGGRRAPSVSGMRKLGVGGIRGLMPRKAYVDCVERWQDWLWRKGNMTV